MVKKYWKLVMIAALILFIGVNFFLIFQKESKIDRAVRVDDWAPIKVQDLVLSKKKDGVVVPLEEEYVYYQESIGSFSEFLVREGEEVDVGTPLFEYSSVQVDQLITQYEGEVVKLEKEREALEDSIEELESIQLTDYEVDEWFSVETRLRMIDTQILEKELQLKKVEGEIERLEELLDSFYEGQDRFTVESPIAGVVKKIKFDLNNPVITISSDEKGVKGILTEEEIGEFEEGMQVVVTPNGTESKLDGTVLSIGKNPVEDPEVGKESAYTFKVELFEPEEEMEEFSDEEAVEEEEEVDEVVPVELVSGTKVEMKVILDEAFDTLTVPEEAVQKGYVYFLLDNGKVEKREVELGIEVDGVVEIFVEGEEGEYVVSSPARIKNGMEYFTPIELNKIRKSAIKSIGKKEIARNIGLGLLTR